MKGKLAKTIVYTIAAICICIAVGLIVFGLPFSGWKALSVQTGSMRPAINPGSLVLVHRVPDSSLRIGDVITYSSRSSQRVQVTHRIVAFKSIGPLHEIIVKGDANKAPDLPVMQQQIVGKVQTHIPYVGRILDFLHKPAGLILFVYLPALLLVGYELKELSQRLADAELDKRASAARQAGTKLFTTLRPIPAYSNPKQISVSAKQGEDGIISKQQAQEDKSDQRALPSVRVRPQKTIDGINRGIA